MTSHSSYGLRTGFDHPLVFFSAQPERTECSLVRLPFRRSRLRKLRDCRCAEVRIYLATVAAQCLEIIVEATAMQAWVPRSRSNSAKIHQGTDAQKKRAVTICTVIHA